MKKEKRIRRLLLLLTVILCMGSGAAPAMVTSAATGQKASQKYGLVKSGGKYYYYEKECKKVKNKWVTKRRKVKNQWVTVKVKGKKRLYYFGKNGAAYTGGWKTIKNRRYYFQKNGAACAGKKQDGYTFALVKKIGKYTYAFDSKGRMLTGVQLILNKSYERKFYVFDSRGRMDAEKTKVLRQLSPTSKTVPGNEPDAEALKQKLLEYGAKYKKTEYFGTGCYGADGEDGYMEWDTFDLYIFKYAEDGRVAAVSVEPNQI